MVFITTFNNISAILWRSVLLGEETGGPGENQVGECSNRLFKDTKENSAFSLYKIKKKKHKQTTSCHLFSISDI